MFDYSVTVGVVFDLDVDEFTRYKFTVIYNDAFREFCIIWLVLQQYASGCGIGDTGVKHGNSLGIKAQ